MALPPAGDGAPRELGHIIFSTAETREYREITASLLQQNMLGTTFHCSLKQQYCDPIEEAEGSTLDEVAPYLHQNCHD